MTGSSVLLCHLEMVPDFDAQDTLPELQHDFYRLWNDLIRMKGDSANRRM